MLTFEITKDVGVCSLHWRENHATVPTPGGKETPRHPPSVFTDVPPSCFRQTTPAAPHEFARRMVDSESRARIDEMKEIEKDIISSWEDLK